MPTKFLIAFSKVDKSVTTMSNSSLSVTLLDKERWKMERNTLLWIYTMFTTVANVQSCKQSSFFKDSERNGEVFFSVNDPCDPNPCGGGAEPRPNLETCNCICLNTTLVLDPEDKSCKPSLTQSAASWNISEDKKIIIWLILIIIGYLLL